MLDIGVLGPLSVQRDGAFVPVPGETQRRLLALLVLHRWEAVPGERLVEELWPADPPRNPRNALQQSMVKLRTGLRDAAGEVALTEGRAYRLNPAAVTVDADRFEAAVDRGREDLAGGAPSPAQRRLAEALGHWRGTPYADLVDSAVAGPEVTRLEELRLLALEDRIEADLDLVRPETSVVELSVLVDEHPLRERLWRHLMVALYRSGRQADALETYARARRRLREDAGVEPGAELRRVQGLVLAQDPSLDAPRRPLGVTSEPLQELLGAVRSAAGVLADAGRGDEQADLLLAYARALNGQPAAYDHQVWLHELDAAHDRLRAAIDRAVEQQREDVALGLVVEVARYWDHRRLLGIAHETLERVVTACGSASARRSEALTWWAFFLFEGGEVDGALARLDEAVAVAEEAGVPARVAGARAVASVVLRDTDPGRALAAAEDAVDLFVRHGTRRETAYGWTTHAHAALADGRPGEAATSARAAAAVYAELGDRRGLAWTKATQRRSPGRGDGPARRPGCATRRGRSRSPSRTPAPPTGCADPGLAARSRDHSDRQLGSRRRFRAPSGASCLSEWSSRRADPAGAAHPGRPRQRDHRRSVTCVA